MSDETTETTETTETSEVTLTQADIDKAVQSAVSGLKSKNSELLGKLKEQAEAMKQFDGIDPTAVRSILQRFTDDEEAKLIASGKIDEVLNKRTERMKGEYDKKLSQAMKEAETAKGRAAKFTQRVLDDSIRAAASKAGLHTHAVDDALFRGRSMFQLDEEGQAVAIDSEGSVVIGKDGKTPLTPAEWLESMKESAPHWFPATTTGGGTNPSKPGSGKTMTQQEYDDLPPKTRAARMDAGWTVR